MVIFPVIMLVAYIPMFFYFKVKGNYQVQHLPREKAFSKRVKRCSGIEMDQTELLAKNASCFDCREMFFVDGSWLC